MLQELPTPLYFPCEFSAPSWVERAAHPFAAALQHVRIEHRRADIFMPEQFLYSTDIVAIFEQMRGKAMALMSRATLAP